MKQLLLSLTMLICFGNAFGQTPAKLIEKYKAMPGAVYENTTDQSLKDLVKDSEDSILSVEEIAKLKKNFKKSEQVQIQNASKELLAQIDKDVKALKNHELIFETVRNIDLKDSEDPETSEDANNIIKQMFSFALNPSIKFQCYGKTDDKVVSDLLLRVEISNAEIWNTVALSHIDIKIDKDLWMRLLENNNFSLDYEENDKEQE